MSRTVLFHISGNQYSPFPARHHTRRIWDELSKGFDEYHVIARGESNSYVHSIDGVIHLHLLPGLGERMWVFFFISWLLPYFVLRYRPTHLLAQCPVLGGLAAAFCSKIFGIRLFVEIHGAHYFSPARPGWKGVAEHMVYRVLSRITFGAATRIRSLSEDMSDFILRGYGKRVSDKVIVIPNRVDLDVFSHVKKSYAKSERLKVISVGGFSKNKNHLALIEDLVCSGIDFELTLAGAGPLAEKYMELATRLGVADRISALSMDHPTLSSALPLHDIYVHYSLSEGVPRAILEAMASGLPVVATRVGFIKGVLVNDGNALVIDLPYRDGLTRCITELSESEALRERLGQAARTRIETHHEWNHVFDQYRAAIREMS